jgi:hypothetical protein
MRARDVVRAALPRLRADETTFLHPASECGECDEARKAIEVQEGRLAPPAKNG